MTRLFTLLALTAIAGTAAAGDKKDREEVEIRYKAVTDVDFSEVDVKATAERPAIKYVSPLTGMVFKSMIRPRVEWDHEMKRSVDDIK